jgi:peptidoglycan/LPS O-acetylase OafA/YrhL
VLPLNIGTDVATQMGVVHLPISRKILTSGNLSALPMGSEMLNGERRHTFEFINGLRGLAALQVVLLHYCSSFLPLFARIGLSAHYAFETKLGYSPVFFLIDGYSAVYLFFLMSGFVLAPSFLKNDSGISLQISKRFVRLYIPVMGALALALALCVLLPSAKEFTWQHTQSGWVNGLFLNPLTVPSVLQELLFNSMLLSYQEVSIFHPLLTLAPVTHSLDAPLWTIHIEFWGSLLVILVCAVYRRLPKVFFWPIFAILLVCTSYDYFSLFLVGFALSTAKEYVLRCEGVLYRLAGLGMIAIAIVVSSSVHADWFTPLATALDRIASTPVFAAPILQRQLCTILLFVGVIMLGPNRRWLEGKWVLWLGRISFSLYLIHFPILFTATFLVFKVLVMRLSYGAAALSATAIMLPITLIVAHYFEKYIDGIAISLSRRVGKIPKPAAMRSLES